MLTRWREGVRHPLPKPPTAEQPPYLVGEYDPAAAPLLPCKPPETPAAAEPVKHIEFACMSRTPSQSSPSCSTTEVTMDPKPGIKTSEAWYSGGVGSIAALIAVDSSAPLWLRIVALIGLVQLATVYAACRAIAKIVGPLSSLTELLWSFRGPSHKAGPSEPPSP